MARPLILEFAEALYHVTSRGDRRKAICLNSGDRQGWLEVFQGRYKAILLQKEAYLLELSRYVVLNPVRARMVEQPDAWPWSSDRATTGLAKAPV